MRVVRARLRAAVLATLLASLVASMLPVLSVAAQPAGLDAFLYAVGQVESSGRYDAVNPTSGARGKYQIMPANWPSWAGTFLGNSKASWSPANQDAVARGKMTELYGWLGQWRYVAYWWLTGRDGRNRTWTTYATRYVNKVMTAYNARLGVSAAPIDTRVWYTERSDAIAYDGTWTNAGHAGYIGGAVRYATADGASATFTFRGTRVTWYGPKGPTRGKAVVSVDGKVVRTIDLYASSFLSRRSLFTWYWARPGIHTITIEVQGVPRRPYVAIDAFAVTP